MANLPINKNSSQHDEGSDGEIWNGEAGSANFCFLLDAAALATLDRVVGVTVNQRFKRKVCV